MHQKCNAPRHSAQPWPHRVAWQNLATSLLPSYLQRARLQVKNFEESTLLGTCLVCLCVRARVCYLVRVRQPNVNKVLHR